MRKSTGQFVLVAALISVLGSTGPRVSAQRGAPQGDWPAYAGDAGGTKYSSLDQISKDNVKNLRIAWRWKSDNFGPMPVPYLQSTPVAAGGVLYTVAGSRRNVVAIDGATGETLWMYRLEEGARGDKAPIRGPVGRGLAYWTDGKDSRILHVTLGYRLVALDAKTGAPVPRFGQNGMVDLYEHLPRPIESEHRIGWNSAATVVGNVIVIGAATRNGQSRAERPLSMPVRGYDVRTGKRLWTFHTIPRRGEFGAETWEDGSLEYASNVGMWITPAADPELGYVYLPIETPGADNYGGHRPGNNLFSDSLVCLDAKTGKRIWHYQFVHHDLWDYDIPAQPVLADITVNGRKIKAVAQVTKQGFTFVFDRVTGEPVWPIEERPVPQSNVPGEKSSPTQPFPTKPAPFDRQAVTLEDVIDFTPEIKAEALQILSQYRLGGVFTPPSLFDPSDPMKGTLKLPAMTGGANWQGAGLDPETGILYVPSVTNIMAVQRIRECEPGPTTVPAWKYCAGGGGGGGPGGLTVQGLPLVKPPWGRLTAIDLNSGEHLWMVANAETPDYVRNHPALKGATIPKTGRPDRGPVLVTKTLLFTGEGSGLYSSPSGSGGPIFRAHDKRTGEIIWELALPANQASAPMTYMAGGKQYIVVATGAPNYSGEYVALALP